MTSHDISWHLMTFWPFLTCVLWCDCLLYHLAQILQNFMRWVRSGCVACWSMLGQTWRHAQLSFWIFNEVKMCIPMMSKERYSLTTFCSEFLPEAKDANGATPVIFAAIYLAAVCCESIGSQCSRLQKMQRLMIPSGFLLRSSVAASGAWNSSENLAKEPRHVSHVVTCRHTGVFENPAPIRLVFHDPPWA